MKEEFSNLEIKVRSILGEHINPNTPKHSIKLNRIGLDTFDNDPDESTSILWISQVTVFITALSDLQKTIDIIKGQPSKPVIVKSFSRNSPIEVSLDGAAEAIKVVHEMLPSQRDYVETKKGLEIEASKAEILKIRAEARREHEESKKIETERDVEVEHKRLDNEKLRLEIEEKRINLVLKVLDRLSPELSQTQKILYSMELLKPLGVIIDSPFLIVSQTDEE